MSLQYKCERCGKVAAIEYEDKRPIMPNSWMRIALIQKETRHIDICSDCIDAMIEFIGKAEIGAQLVTTKIDLEEVISSAVHHAFSVSTNNARKPKEFFAAYPWLDEIEENADHYQYMFCDEWVQYWGFIRILYSSVADSVAKWCYAKRNDLPWVDWDSIDYEQDREKEAESEPKDEPEPETDDPEICPTYCEGVRCWLQKGHKGDHSYKCESPNCPGYTWPASARPHPSSCYSEPEAESTEDDKKPSSGAASDESTPLEYFVYCDRVIDGRQCILHKGHKGDCLFICDDPNCPGYAWPASEKRPHPTSTCQP